MENNKKYFIASDIHSFFTIFKKALDKAGWQQNNPNHVLVIAGDLFDRGEESEQLLQFVQSLGDRFIYVRGNHEDLLEDCVYELSTGMRVGEHHIGNGTVRTISQLCDIGEFEIYSYIYNRSMQQDIHDKMKPILEWIREKAVDYAEINNYIITHGWIPIIPTHTDLYGRPDRYKFDPTWNKKPEDDASIEEISTYNKKWDRARWLNGMDCWKQGVIIPDKTIICGHYHCSWGWSHIRQKYKEFPDKSRKDFAKSFQPFTDKGIIALDACTAYSGICNILVIDEESK